LDVARVRAAVRGAWSTGQSNDTSTITWTLVFGEAEVVREETWTQIGGASSTRPQGSVPYEISEHGALAFAPSTSEELRFTAIVAEGEICAALHDRPCRVLGSDGFLAQSPTVYRREYERARDDGKGMRRAGFVATLRLAHPPSKLAATPRPPCTLALDITATGGGTAPPITRSFDFDCDVTPAARGPLARLAVHGFDTHRDGLASAWSNHVALRRLVDPADRATYDVFRAAFQPVVYFDPADPWVLYFDRPAGYHAAP
jgi:hypothetical protein